MKTNVFNEVLNTALLADSFLLINFGARESAALLLCFCYCISSFVLVHNYVDHRRSKFA